MTRSRKPLPRHSVFFSRTDARPGSPRRLLSSATLLSAMLLAACAEDDGSDAAPTDSAANAEASMEEGVAVNYGGDGMAAASEAAAPDAPVAQARYETAHEDRLLSNIRQLVTEGLRSGEGYFSADGSELIYQAEVPGNPFYQIFLMDLETGESQRVSPGIGLTTCAWIHPDADRVMFSSTHEDPNALSKQADELAFRASGEERAYGWDYDRHYEIYTASKEGDELVNLSNSDGYDAEGSYSSDGSQILFASNREAYTRSLSQAEQALFDDDASYFMDLYVMDADGSNVRQLTRSPGYDGGPFFSPDDSRVVWRRFNPDGNSAEIWTMDSDGSNQRQLTADAMVSWGPYFHPSGDYIIYSSNVLGHANFELFMIDVEGRGEPVRVSNTEGTDILPVFSPDGRQLAWSTTRTPDGSSQIHLADWNHELALQLLGLDGGAGQAANGADG